MQANFYDMMTFNTSATLSTSSLYQQLAKLGFLECKINT